MLATCAAGDLVTFRVSKAPISHRCIPWKIMRFLTRVRDKAADAIVGIAPSCEYFYESILIASASEVGSDFFCIPYFYRDPFRLRRLKDPCNMLFDCT